MTTLTTAKLLEAAFRGDQPTVQGWLDAGGDLEARNEAGFTPLLVALEGKQPALASWLLDRGASPRARLEAGFSAMAVLTKHFRNRPVDFRVTVTRAGKDVTLTDKAEVRAELGSHPDDVYDALLACARKLLERGFDLSTTSGPKRTPPLRYAAEVSAELAMTLLEHGSPDVNASDAEGFTALHLAGRFGHLALAQELLARGATVDAADSFGFTPLHEAIMNGKEDVAGLLLQRGADVKRALTGGYAAYQPGDAAADIARKSGRPALARLVSAG